MRRPFYLMLTLALLACTPAVCQEAAPAASGATLPGATLNVYAFPSAGQSEEKQAEDEGFCYAWAARVTGVDPLAMAQQAPREELKMPEVTAPVKPTEAGQAAPGALIGDITGPATGPGGSSDATVGALIARRQAREKKQAQAFLSGRVTNFKKAMSACLKAKSYVVEY